MSIETFWHLHVSQIKDMKIKNEKSKKALPFAFSNEDRGRGQESS
jgi:hypothetical protein